MAGRTTAMGKPGAVFRDQRLRQTLGQGVSVGPAQFGGALHAGLGQIRRAASGRGSCGSDFPAPRPCRSLAACSLLKRLLPQLGGHFGALRELLRPAYEVMQRSPFLLGIEVRQLPPACSWDAASRPPGRRALPPRSRWKDAAARHDPTGAQIPVTFTAASTLVASASRRSGLKSVRPELLMIRSRFFCRRLR